jgi:hypothetical protein
VNRRNLFKSLAAICAAPLVKWLPRCRRKILGLRGDRLLVQAETGEVEELQWQPTKNYTFTYTDA